jgi:hypothetical protein
MLRKLRRESGPQQEWGEGEAMDGEITYEGARTFSPQQQCQHDQIANHLADGFSLRRSAADWKSALRHFKLKINAFTSANSWGFRMRFIEGTLAVLFLLKLVLVG